MSNFLSLSATRDIMTSPRSWQLIHRNCGVTPNGHPSRAQKKWMMEHGHRHACMDILAVLQGTGWYGMDNQIFSCRPGTIFIFQPNQIHQCGYPTVKNSFAHLWIGILNNDVLIRLIFGQNNRIKYDKRLDIHMTLEECGIMNLPSANIDKPDPAYGLRATSLIAALFAGIIESVRARKTVDDRDMVISRKITAIRRHIQDTGGRDSDLEQLAHLAGYSKFHFSRLFKIQTGQTVHEYVDKCRMQKTRELRDKGLSMKEISARLHFATLSSFSHWYHKHNNIKRV